MYFAENRPVLARLVYAQPDDAHLLVGVQLRLGNAVGVKGTDDDEIVGQFFKVCKLGRFQICVFEHELDGGADETV